MSYAILSVSSYVNITDCDFEKLGLGLGGLISMTVVSKIDDPILCNSSTVSLCSSLLASDEEVKLSVLLLLLLSDDTDSGRSICTFLVAEFSITAFTILSIFEIFILNLPCGSHCHRQIRLRLGSLRRIQFFDRILQYRTFCCFSLSRAKRETALPAPRLFVFKSKNRSPTLHCDFFTFTKRHISLDFD